MARRFVQVEYRILGPLEVRDGDHTVQIPGRKEKALLALLLVELGTVVSADRMVFELWGDEAPATAAQNLRTLVSRLRRHLGKETIITQRPGYRIGAEPEDVDAHLFEQLADEAARDRSQSASTAETAERALALWRGRALADFECFHFADNEARRLEQRKLTTMELAFDSGLALGRHADLVADLRAAVDQNPLHEPFYRMLMLALYRSGRAAEALKVYTEAELVLGEELGIEPTQEVRSIERSIVMEDSSLDLISRTSPNNLPTAFSSFVGRDEELASLIAALPRRRMVTLTGPGGSGKSRLALETATRVLNMFRDGVWRVELAPLRDPDSVVPAIGNAFGDPVSHAADPMGSLIDLLRERHLLLVIDNCEHLVAATARIVSTILQRCPDVTIMATSREALGIPGESVWLVPPLRVPEVGAPVEEQEQAEAVRLFVSRAKDAASAFELSDENRHHVFDICRLVDGLPLALELAATRVSSLSPRAISERVSHDLGVLSAPRGSAAARHQTMRAALDWSYQLLDDRSAAIFRKLAVFRGGWTVDDSQALLGADSTDVIADLVGGSLVERLHGRRLDYRLLEPIREYATELLNSSPDLEPVSERHAEVYAELASKADEGLRSHEQMDWLRLLEDEHDNLREAIAWSLEFGKTQRALELVASLGLFWFMGGHWQESWEWLTKALDAAGERYPVERAAAVYRTGAIQVIRVNHEAVMPHVHRSLETCRSTGNRYGEAWCLHLIGHAIAFASPEGSLQPLTEARQIFEELSCEWEVAWSDRYIGSALCEIGRVDEGSEVLLRSISDFREMGDLSQTAYSLFSLGGTLVLLDDYGPEVARPYLLRCLRLSEQIGDRVWAAHATSRLAIASHLSGVDDAHSRFIEAAERHRVIGDDACLASTFGYLAEIEEQRGEEASAAGYLAEAIRIGMRISATAGVAINFDRLAALGIRMGRAGVALRLLQAVQQSLDSGELSMHPILAAKHEELVALMGVPIEPQGSIANLVPLALELAESIREDVAVGISLPN